jgi:UDP-N-acetylmuramate dehydrogenase
VNLADLTTLRLGGPVRDLRTCTSEAEVLAAVEPGVVVLGGGSNVVAPDEGLDVVALIRNDAFFQEARTLRVAAGLTWDVLVVQALEAGLTGLEAMSGIPGTVGAAPLQNIGAYGAEIASFVENVRVLDRTTGEVAEVAAADCGFGYRTSRFKQQPGRWVVLEVHLELPTGDQPVRYAELARALGVEVGETAPAHEVRHAVLELRRSKGMVLDPADPDSVSAGSFFTNPLVEAVPDGAPSWPDASGLTKVSAAWLIEHAGFGKGWGDGRIGLSTKHTLALVNRGGGTTAELLEVMRTVQDGVEARFGIRLENEPVLL